MRPYLIPPIIVGIAFIAVGAPVWGVLILSTALYLHCRHYYCHDADEDYKLLQEIKYQRWQDKQRQRFDKPPLGYTTSNPLSEVNTYDLRS